MSGQHQLDRPEGRPSGDRSLVQDGAADAPIDWNAMKPIPSDDPFVVWLKAHRGPSIFEARAAAVPSPPPESSQQGRLRT